MNVNQLPIYSVEQLNSCLMQYGLGALSESDSDEDAKTFDQKYFSLKPPAFNINNLSEKVTNTPLFNSNDFLPVNNFIPLEEEVVKDKDDNKISYSAILKNNSDIGVKPIKIDSDSSFKEVKKRKVDGNAKEETNFVNLRSSKKCVLINKDNKNDYDKSNEKQKDNKAFNEQPPALNTNNLNEKVTNISLFNSSDFVPLNFKPVKSKNKMSYSVILKNMNETDGEVYDLTNKYLSNNENSSTDTPLFNSSDFVPLNFKPLNKKGLKEKNKISSSVILKNVNKIDEEIYDLSNNKNSFNTMEVMSNEISNATNVNENITLQDSVVENKIHDEISNNLSVSNNEDRIIISKNQKKKLKKKLSKKKGSTKLEPMMTNGIISINDKITCLDIIESKKSINEQVAKPDEKQIDKTKIEPIDDGTKTEPPGIPMIDSQFISIKENGTKSKRKRKRHSKPNNPVTVINNTIKQYANLDDGTKIEPPVIPMIDNQFISIKENGTKSKRKRHSKPKQETNSNKITNHNNDKKVKSGTTETKKQLKLIHAKNPGETKMEPVGISMRNKDRTNQICSDIPESKKQIDNETKKERWGKIKLESNAQILLDKLKLYAYSSNKVPEDIEGTDFRKIVQKYCDDFDKKHINLAVNNDQSMRGKCENQIEKRSYKNNINPRKKLAQQNEPITLSVMASTPFNLINAIIKNQIGSYKILSIETLKFNLDDFQNVVPNNKSTSNVNLIVIRAIATVDNNEHIIKRPCNMFEDGQLFKPYNVPINSCKRRFNNDILFRLKILKLKKKLGFKNKKMYEIRRKYFRNNKKISNAVILNQNLIFLLRVIPELFFLGLFLHFFLSFMHWTNLLLL